MTGAAEPGAWRLSRDPALLGALVIAAVQVVLTLIPLPASQVALINAVAVAAVGFAVAVVIRSDRWVPGLLGLIKASGSLVVGLGLHWSPQSQAAVMLLGSTLTAVITRTQVVAPAPDPPAARPSPVPSPGPSGRHARKDDA
jgi:hypothetical protein